MPSPLSPSSSQEIIPISPPIASSSKRRLDPTSTVLPTAISFKPKGNLRVDVAQHLKNQKEREDIQSGKRKRLLLGGSPDDEGKRRKGKVKSDDMSRTQMTAQMMSTLGTESNPITHSDLYTRSDHFVSAATGHQQSNRGGGSSGATTYWAVRTAKMADQARESKSDLFKGCVFYINGSTGPKVSNLQLQHLITSNGGRFLAMQSASCTHIVALGGLSGSKTQKWINGQASRGASKRTKVIKPDWIIDCVEKGKRISETPYGVIEDPSQKNLLQAFMVQEKG